MKRDKLTSVAVYEANLYMQDGATIRDVSRAVGRSKSTVAYDLRTRLIGVDDELNQRVQDKLDSNIENAPYMASHSRI